LRISDGKFTNSNVSKWYGHIKRDVWGNSAFVSLGGLSAPAQAEQFNNWYLKNQELKAPTVVRMSGAYDSGGVINASNEVGIYVYDPRTSYSNLESDTHYLWADAIGINPFDEDDSYTCTFVYDYNNESELGRDSDGKLGVSGFTVVDQNPDSEETVYQGTTGTDLNLVNGAVAASDTTITVDDASVLKQYSYIRIDEEIIFITSISGEVLTVVRGMRNTTASAHEDNSKIYLVPSKQKARAINLVVYTGASNGSWNERITGINLYWRPKGDVDWYLVAHYDVEKGFSDSSFATQNYIATGGTTYNLNWGYWQQCPSNSHRHASIGTIDAVGGGGNLWGDTGYFISDAVDDYAFANDNLSGSDLTYADMLNCINTVWAKVVTASSNDSITVAANYLNRVNQGYSDRGGVVGESVVVADTVTDTVTTWYLPFDGSKIATYAGLTGRTQEDRVRAVRWKISCVTDSGIVVIGNVDTKDDNDQTVRERSRIMWTYPYVPDDFHILRSIDVGKDDGDVIIALEYWKGMVFVFKDRNTYVYDFTTGSPELVAHYPGYGCRYRHSVTRTPHGIVVAGGRGIMLHTGNEPAELSYAWRQDYQDLTFSNPVMGYSDITNEIYFCSDSYNSTLVFYRYNFDLRSWSKMTTATNNDVISNIMIGKNYEPVAAVYDSSGNTVVIKEFNTGSGATTTLTVKSKKFDGGNPYRNKYLRRVRAIYKTDAAAADNMTIKLYFDGSGSASETLTFSASSTLTTSSTNTFSSARKFKTIEVEVTCAGDDFVLDEIVIEYNDMGDKL
jgi:hypothetical protein